MHRFIITGALLANALLGGLMLLLLLLQGGWGEPARLSASTVQFVVVIALIAFALNLVLAPVVGLSFWARDRGTRRLEARLEAPAARTGAKAPATSDGEMRPGVE